MRIMVTGSRRWPDTARWRSVIYRALRTTVHQGDILVHGGAIGADTFASSYAQVQGATLEEWKPEYDKHPPKLAPLRRNDDMLDSGIDLLLAFVYGYPEHGGTLYTIEGAKQRGIPTIVHQYPEKW